MDQAIWNYCLLEDEPDTLLVPYEKTDGGVQKEKMRLGTTARSWWGHFVSSVSRNNVRGGGTAKQIRESQEEERRQQPKETDLTQKKNFRPRTFFFRNG